MQFPYSFKREPVISFKNTKTRSKRKDIRSKPTSSSFRSALIVHIIYAEPSTVESIRGKCLTEPRAIHSTDRWLFTQFAITAK